MQDSDHQQCISQSERVGNPIGEENEQPATRESADIKAELLAEDVGILVAMLDGRHGVDHEHLDGEVGDIGQRPAQYQKQHEQEHAEGVEQRGVGQAPRAKSVQPAANK